ncbi:MAG: NUDIX domain-containing protein [bacterium]|nr:NUDIX domain-containing protein [bacterium]
MIDSDDLLDIVNEKDEVIGADTKFNKFEKELISRNVVAFLKNPKGKYVVVRRAPTKKSFPNLLDISACGNVNKGETYQEAIKREIKEELGIECSVRLLTKIYNESCENGKKVKYFTAIFLGTTREKLRPNKEHEIQQSMNIDELGLKIKNNPELFTPFFVNDFREVESLLR